MYRCQLCKTQIEPGVPCQRVVLERRATVYPERRGVHACHDRHGRVESRLHWHDDPGGEGWEIAREAQACPACAAAWRAPAPALEAREVTPAASRRRRSARALDALNLRAHEAALAGDREQRVAKAS